MPISRALFPFTARLLAGAPEEPGVYVLWRQGEAVFIGHAGGGSTIRACLVDHFSGASGACTRQATHYSWEISLRPAEREGELIEAYLRSHRRLPRCNEAAA